MDRARELAERGRYTAAPNPLVGVVIARDGKVIGEGWHARAGHEHAEAAALSSNGTDARGASMYVTLEPCNHHGRTPPCTEAIVRAGISRVVVGHLDPDPRMRGRSVNILREAGVKVEVLDDPAFERQNEQFFHYMNTGLPFVHLKLAATLDGRIAASGGDSKWITGEAARRRAHALRAEAGAVLVGAGTARADDPSLTVRDVPDQPPPVTRIVLDPSLTLDPESQLARNAGEAQVLVFADKTALDVRQKRLEALGVEVVATPRGVNGLDLRYVLKDIGSRGVRGLLVEGGGDTVGRFLRDSLVDKMTIFYAPKVLGAEGVPMIGALGLTSVQDAPRFSMSGVEHLGDDLAVTFYPREEASDVYGSG